jgi:hypothetical protein
MQGTEQIAVWSSGKDLLPSDFSRHFLIVLLGTCGTPHVYSSAWDDVFCSNVNPLPLNRRAQYILGARHSRVPSKGVSERLNLQWSLHPFPMTLFEGEILEGKANAMEGMSRKRI